MDRSAMLNRWAELVVAGAGEPATAVAIVAPVTYNVEIEKERLALEKFKLGAQIMQQYKDREAQLKLQGAKIMQQEKDGEAQIMQQEK